jgi:hypothetical protein
MYLCNPSTVSLSVRVVGVQVTGLKMWFETVAGPTAAAKPPSVIDCARVNTFSGIGSRVGCLPDGRRKKVIRGGFADVQQERYSASLLDAGKLTLGP